MSTKTLFSLFVLVLAISLASQAKVKLKNTKRLVLPTDISQPLISAETNQKLLPKSITAEDSGSNVVSKIVDNSLSVWWDQSPMRQTSVGRAAEKIEKNMKAEVDFGKSEATPAGHKLSVKLLAMQALARLEYKGWVRAAINYDARAARTETEVLENLAKNKDLVLSHTFSSAETKSQVSLRMNW